MSGGEIIVIFLVMLLLFGSKKLPDLARTLGKGMREFQKAKDEIQNELNRSTADIRNDLTSSAQSFQTEVEELKNDLAKEAQDMANVDQTNIEKADEAEDTCDDTHKKTEPSPEDKNLTK